MSFISIVKTPLIFLITMFLMFLKKSRCFILFFVNLFVEFLKVLKVCDNLVQHLAFIFQNFYVLLRLFKIFRHFFVLFILLNQSFVFFSKCYDLFSTFFNCKITLLRNLNSICCSYFKNCYRFILVVLNLFVCLLTVFKVWDSLF